MTPRAQEFLDRVSAWAGTRDDIRLVMVVGSQARDNEPADDFSDLDIVMAVGRHKDYLLQTDWLIQLGDPVLSFIEATAIGGERERRVLFQSGLDVDFTIIAAETLAAFSDGNLPPDVANVLARGTRIIVDKDRLGPPLLKQVPQALAPVLPLSAAAFLERTHDFLYHCLWTVRKAARGELFVALRCLEGLLRPYLFDLARDHLLHRKGPAATQWYGSRMIDRWADPDTVAKLAQTCAVHERESVFQAVRSAIALYAKLGHDVAARLGISYPAAQERRIRALIEETAGL